ncbi:hypothetical protein ABGB07_02080 [Micromonosporaceae bacterium B7E4]
MKVRLTGKGTRPLLMHNVRLASPLNAYAKQLKALNSKRVKTDEDRLAVARVEFEGSLYFDDEVGPYVPGPNLLASLVEGGRLTKAGKKIERGVNVDDLIMPLIYRGPRDVESLWGGGESEYVDLRTVVVQRNKVDRCRPIFREWAFEAEILLDPAVIDLAEFTDVARNAGGMAGIGDYRRMYGRYSVEIEAL